MAHPKPSVQTGRQLFIDRAVDPSNATPQQLAAACAALNIGRTTLELSNRYQARLIKDPIWGLVLDALWRVQEYAEGALSAALVSLPTAEITSRTVVEGAINVQYMLAGEPRERLFSYFGAYLRQEEEQNKKWSAEASLLPPGEEADEHRKALEQKARVIALQREVVDDWFRGIGLSSEPLNWGSAFDRFKAVGQAIEYRTTYAALCSQTHNDAEDLINSFVLQAMGAGDMTDSLRKETQAFSWFAVTLGLRHYARAAAAYWTYFNLLPAGTAERLLSSVDALAADAAESVRSGSLEGRSRWRPNER